MSWRPFVFALLATAAAGAAMAQPSAPDGMSERYRLERLLVDKGYTLEPPRAFGGNLVIIRFSSAGCTKKQTVIPVSVILQESTLLNQIGEPDDHRYFVYMDQHWQSTQRSPVALARLWQQFAEIAHLQPRPSLDTMLYFAVPKGCTLPVNWSGFWQS